MKTISDIKENVELLHTMDRHARMETEKRYKAKIFAYYDEVEEIKKVMSDFENLSNGEYRFDEHGDFVYSIDLPREIKELPEIGDYLTQDMGHYKDGRLTQFLSGPISINRHDSRCYFIFDHEMREPILKERPKTEHPVISLETYIKAKIELYMRSKGECKDVIEVDYYGGYMGHFSTLIDGYENLDSPTDEELESMVREFEDYLTE